MWTNVQAVSLFLWIQWVVRDTERMYMAWLLSWWCLPLSTGFHTVHLVSFYWMLSLVLFTYHNVVDSAKKILCIPDTVYNNNNTSPVKVKAAFNSLKVKWSLLIFPDNNCTIITVTLKGLSDHNNLIVLTWVQYMFMICS